MSTATLAEAIDDAHRGKSTKVRCPVHDDKQASLHVSPGTQPNADGVVHPVVLHCHAGCRPEDIMAAEGLDWSLVCERPDTTTVEDEWTPAGPASHVYDYVDEHGQLLFQALRIPQPGGRKDFRQRRPDPTQPRGWTWNLQDTRRVLYRLPEVIEAVRQGRTIYIPEGEKDVEALRADGHAATCNPMGALKWRDEFSTFLAGARVVIIADKDDTGGRHSRMVRDSLVAVDAIVDIVESPLANCKDYSDHRARGQGVESLVVRWSSAPQSADTGAMSIVDMLAAEWDEGVEVIPGFLAKSNVVVFTGFEGHGKSMLLRQVAVCCAVGLNPFTLEQMPPLRVLYVDAENPEHQQVMDWRKLDRLARMHTGAPIPADRLTILSEWMSEPDLTTTTGQAWLYERVQVHKPDLMVMGPVQNLVSRDVKDDEVVRKLKHAINTARAMCGTAFMLEHHAPLRMQGDKERAVRPYGSSLFLKWPDFGYGLQPIKDDPTGSRYRLHANRKPRVRSRAWPEIVRWGSAAPESMEWPWVFEEADLHGSRKDDGKGADWSGRRGA